MMNSKVAFLFGLFIAALVSANLLGNKLTTIFGITASVGVFAYPLTFLITDVVKDNLGKKTALQFYKAGFAALLLTLLLTFVARVVPPASFYANNEAYNHIFGNSLRIIVASLLAFLFAQYHDLWAFGFWKRLTKGKYLWLRNNLSTIVSQFIDTTLFTFIAFYLVTPEYTLVRMFAMILPYWALKVAFALFDTPFCYLGRWWFRSGNRLPPKAPAR